METTVRGARRTSPATRALLCCLACLAIGAGHQLPAPASTYRLLVDEYRHQNDASVERASALTASEIRGVLDEALAFRDGSPAWTADDLRAAAMLHANACLSLLKLSRFEEAFTHLDAAARLIEATVLRDPSSRRFAGLWFATVTTILHKMGAPAWAGEPSKRSKLVMGRPEGAVVSAQAEAAFARGLDMEIVACQVDPGVPINGFGMQLSTSLRAAARHHEEALRQDSSLHEAALHLGRSRLLLGELDDARRWLEVATKSSLASERYLALLYLGSIDEQQARVADAETRYRAAIAAFPWGQSGGLALARLLSRTNREADSRAMVESLLKRRGRTIDPLWTYLATPGSEPGPILNLLRAEIWK